MDNNLRLAGRQVGRIQLFCGLSRLGADLFAILFGGEAHIGALALAAPGARTDCIAAPGHREDEIARALADHIARALNCRVAVACGIHYDNITKSEIAIVGQLAEEMGDLAISALRKPLL